MFVCPVPKISQVKMKRRHQASHLGRDTLWHNGRWATTQLGRFTLCGTTVAKLPHNSVNLLCVAQRLPSYYTTRLDLLCVAQRPPRYYTLNSVRFILCGTTTVQLHNLVDLLCRTTAVELKHTFSKDSDEPGWKYEGLIQNKILLRVLNTLEDSTNPWQTQIDMYTLRRQIAKMNAKDTWITMWVSASKWGKT